MRHVISGIIKIIFTTFIVATITFFLLQIMPGSPFSGDKNLPPEIIANLEAKYHLDEPITTQYYLYMKGLIQGDLGPSLKYKNRSVNDILKSSLPVSMTLGIFALLISIPIGLFFGIISAVSKKKTYGSILIVLITIGISLPNFLIAAILINIFAVKLKVLPVALWESPVHMVLPIVTLSFLPAAYIARLTRAQMIEQLSEEYVKTGLAKGLSFNSLIYKHVFKNCLISVITILGPIIAILTTGSFVVEFIFAIPGMGRHFVTAFTNRDYFLITGIAITFSFILTTLNVVIDLLYRKIDPRIV